MNTRFIVPPSEVLSSFCGLCTVTPQTCSSMEKAGFWKRILRERLTHLFEDLLLPVGLALVGLVSSQSSAKPIILGRVE